MEFLYTENVTRLKQADLDHINELYSVADMYIVDQLKQLCVKSLIKHIKMKNICKLTSESYWRGISEVKNKCVDFIVKHFGTVIGMDEFVEFPQPLLWEIFKIVSAKGVTVNESLEMVENNEH